MPSTTSPVHLSTLIHLFPHFPTFSHAVFTFTDICSRKWSFPISHRMPSRPPACDLSVFLRDSQSVQLRSLTFTYVHLKIGGQAFLSLKTSISISNTQPCLCNKSQLLQSTSKHFKVLPPSGLPSPSLASRPFTSTYIHLFGISY
jgi:hypothetical protein